MSRSPQLCASLFLCLWLAPPAAAQGMVWVVDDDGGTGADFESLHVAVTEAGEGDILLVKEGSYGSFTIDGKSIQVHAERDAQVDVGVVTVRNLAPEQSVVLRGLDLSEASLIYRLLVLADNRGAVWLEDLHIEVDFGVATVSSGNSIDLVSVARSDQVVFTRCHLVGGDGIQGIFGATSSCNGLTAVDSRIAFYESAVSGGDGFDSYVTLFGNPVTAEDGSSAVSVDGGFFFVSGGMLAGGSGGRADSFSLGACTDGGDGAPGLYQTGQLSETFLHGSDVLGGSGGAMTLDGPCSDGVDASSVLRLDGTHTVIDGEPRSMRVDSPLRAGDTATVELIGQAGELVMLLIAFDTDFKFVRLPPAVALVQNAAVRNLGYLPASGQALSQLATGPSIPGAQALSFRCQAVFVDLGPPLEYAISSPSAALLLDSSF